MISGVAQVIGMKPIFRSFFSTAPPLPASCAIACRLAIGNTLPTAAIAVWRPTALMKLRRSASCGNSAFISVASTNSFDSASTSALTPRALSSAAAWSASLGCAPQVQPRRSGRSAS